MWSSNRTSMAPRSSNSRLSAEMPTSVFSDISSTSMTAVCGGRHRSMIRCRWSPASRTGCGPGSNPTRCSASSTSVPCSTPLSKLAARTYRSPWPSRMTTARGTPAPGASAPAETTTARSSRSTPPPEPSCRCTPWPRCSAASRSRRPATTITSPAEASSQDWPACCARERRPTAARTCDMADPSTLVVLAPHPDDAVLAVGGLLAQHTRRGGPAVVVTVFAGIPRDCRSPITRRLYAHQPDCETVRIRRREDLAAAHWVQADVVQLPHLEALYRIAPDGTPRYTELEQIFSAPTTELEPAAELMAHQWIADGLLPADAD